MSADAAAPLCLRLLGPFEGQVHGRPLPRLRFRKSQAILALLVLRAGSEVERDWLAGLLWPDTSLPAGLHSVRNCLTDLRRALGPEAHRLCAPTVRTLALDLAGAFADVLAFDAALARGNSEALVEAVALYRGPLLEGWEDAWAFQQRQAREQGYLGALEKLAALAWEQGDLAEAERCLRRAVATDPLRESAQRALLGVLAAGGNYTAVLTTYRELRQRLHREAHSAPDPETQALFQRLRDEARARTPARVSPRPVEMAMAAAASPENGSSTDASPRPAVDDHRRAAIRHCLPLSLTSFIGRQDEIAEIQQLLSPREEGRGLRDEETSTSSHPSSGYPRSGGSPHPCRLVTLTGAGGCGKSRLALEVARGLGSSYPDGVWFVGLASLTDAALVPETVAAVLGVREQPGGALVATLIETLHEQQLLLLLDNCEHLVAACATLAETLLQTCPHLSLLATSREPLGCEGEWPYRVPSLSLPPAEDVGCRVWGVGADRPTPHTRHPTPDTLQQYEAVRLLVERAVAAQPGFAVTEANAPVVVQICQRLDGIPLAIELAAARLKALPLEALYRRLDNMFSLLTGGRRTALPHHQTLRATLDWSYALLTPAEQTLLLRLSVFAGGCTLEAAEAVCGSGAGVGSWAGSHKVGGGVGENEGLSLSAPTPYSQLLTPNPVLDLLTRLAEKSLVVYEEREAEGRYRLLEMIREYARDRLVDSGEAAARAQRHAQYFLALTESAEPALSGPEAGRWLDRLEREHDNLRAALAWARREDAQSDEVQLGLRVGSALVSFWIWRAYHREGQEQLLRLLAHPKAAPPTVGRARALHGAGRFAQFYGDMQTARALFEEDLAVCRCLDDPSWTAEALQGLGDLVCSQGDWAAGRKLIEESLAIRRGLGERGGVAASLNSLAWAAYDQGELPAAGAMAAESLAISREQGDLWTAPNSLEILGNVARSQGELTTARALHEECLAIRRERGEQDGIARMLNCLAWISHQEGDLAVARALTEESLAIHRKREDRAGIAIVLGILGDLANEQGETSTARALLEESLAIHRERGERRMVAVLLNNLANIARAEWDIPAARALADEALAIRRQLGEPHEIAGSLFTLGWISAEEGDRKAARALHEEGLAIRRAVDGQQWILPPLDAVGCLALCQNDRGAARALFQEYLTAAQERNDPSDLARAMVQMGRLAEAEGDFPAASAHFEQALTLLRELNEASRLMGTLFLQGWALRQQRDYSGAGAAFSELHTLSQKQRWSGSVVTPLCLLGEVAGDQGDWEGAAARFKEGLHLCQSSEGRHPQALPQCLSGMARVALARDQPFRAARLLGATFVHWTARGPSAWEIEPRARRDRDRTLTAARARLDETAFAVAWAEGQSMGTEEAVVEALREALGD